MMNVIDRLQLNWALILPFAIGLVLPAEPVSAVAPLEVASRLTERSTCCSALLAWDLDDPGQSRGVALLGECGDASETEPVEQHRPAGKTTRTLTSTSTGLIVSSLRLCIPTKPTVEGAVASARPRAPPSCSPKSV